MASETECVEPVQLGAKIADNMMDLELLRSSIMEGIDSKLSQKEGDMWRRGLKEIKRLQSEQQEVLQVVNDMQAKQESLTAENQQLRAALCAVTGKFELVVNEMRQALQHLPPRGPHHGELSPSPSVASTAASDATCPSLLGSLLHASELAQGRVHIGHLERALRRFGQLPGSFEEAWVKLMGIPEKARLMSELHNLIENRLEVSSKAYDTRDECRTLLVQYEDALRKLQKATLQVLETQNAPVRHVSPDESFTEPTPASSKGNTSLTMGLTPAWPICVEDVAETFCTPVRAPFGSEAGDTSLLGDTSWPTWQGPYPSCASATMAASPLASVGSPAVLSLASALTPAPMLPSGNAASGSPGGSKQLQLAECLAEPTAHASNGMPVPAPGLAGLAAVSPPGLSPLEHADQYATPAQTLGTVTVELKKQPGFTTLGMEVNEERGTAIRVSSIDEHGLVDRYNRVQSSESSMVQVGDLIVQVNGVCGDPAGMLQECKSQQLLLLTIARCGSPGGISSPPSPMGANAPTRCSDGAEIDQVLAEVVPRQHFKEVAAPPASWGRLRPDAQVFIPSHVQASGGKSLAQCLDLDSEDAKASASALPLAAGAAEDGGVAAATDRGEDGVARLLFP